MVIIDARYVLYSMIVLALGMVILAWWLGTRTPARRRAPLADEWEHAPLGLLILTGHREYHRANTTAQHLLGLPGPQGILPDIPWARTLLADRAEARLMEEMRGRYHQVEIAEDRVVRWWVRSGPYGDIVLLWDVSAYHRATEAARMLLSTLAHELRNPLGTIRTHIEILHLTNVPPDMRQQSLNILRDEAARLSHLVDQMLELARLDATPELDLRPIDILPLVEQVMTMLRPHAEKKELRLDLIADAALPPVLADPERLYQVFFNLLDNAITYCRPGDTITIALEDQQGGVYCEVRDEGPGISAADLPRITRRFYRGTKAPGEGSGLGLAIVDEILKRHDSTLHIESRTEGPERGTRASFTLRKAT
ncbi:MAG: HAMP domain-containing sensor histidine kinase [Ardenticatenia bacterium]|nr:HAMP domain-containing sensor histidine kinase [Ardenticatenia bacterium]